MATIDMSAEELERFVIRYKDLGQRNSPVRLFDMMLPRYDRKRYPLLGRSAEQSWSDKRVGEVKGFNLMILGVEAGKGVGMHAHEAEEAFIPLTGRWRLIFGDRGDKSTVLEPFDMVSVPPNLMHGLENLSDTESQILAVQGAPRAATIHWAPSLVEEVHKIGHQGSGVENPGFRPSP